MTTRMTSTLVAGLFLLGTVLSSHPALAGKSGPHSNSNSGTAGSTKVGRDVATGQATGKRTPPPVKGSTPSGRTFPGRGEIEWTYTKQK
jgi:hypothetical protein